MPLPIEMDIAYSAHTVKPASLLATYHIEILDVTEEVAEVNVEQVPIMRQHDIVVVSISYALENRAI